MNSRTEKIIVSSLFFCAGLYFLAGGAGVSEPEEYAPTPAGTLRQAVETPAPASEWERVIYVCRLGDEDVPAVQIAQVETADGQVTATVARVSSVPPVEVAVPRTAPVWDYRAVSARGGASRIAIRYDPAGARAGDDEWILDLEDADATFRRRVRDCTEISDE